MLNFCGEKSGLAEVQVCEKCLGPQVAYTLIKDPQITKKVRKSKKLFKGTVQRDGSGRN